MNVIRFATRGMRKRGSCVTYTKTFLHVNCACKIGATLDAEFDNTEDSYKYITLKFDGVMPQYCSKSQAMPEKTVTVKTPSKANIPTRKTKSEPGYRCFRCEKTHATAEAVQNCGADKAPFASPDELRTLVPENLVFMYRNAVTKAAKEQWGHIITRKYGKTALKGI